jgi:flavin reductase (DIM6/NTAB) family NADH-FMN oxidoreductase RutF
MIDSSSYRQVLGHFPTGVTVVTTMGDTGPSGMAIGSFTSVSLDPPLVGFLPGKTSSSWPAIEQQGRFCVNILAEDQEHVCRAFASKAEDKFAGIGWKPAGATGSPILDGVLAWIDCDVHEVVEAGDHWFVLGLVKELAVAREGKPLVFFRGGYGTFGL